MSINATTDNPSSNLKSEYLTLNEVTSLPRSFTLVQAWLGELQCKSAMAETRIRTLVLFKYAEFP